MKFAFSLIKYFPFGGLQRDFTRIARECAARGHQIDVYTPDWQGAVPRGLNLRVLKPGGFSNHGRRLGLAAELGRHARHGGYDAVVGFSKMPGLDVYFAADSCFAERIRQKPWWYPLTPRCRAYLSLERAVFAPPATTQIMLLTGRDQRLYQHHYGTPEERFHILPPGIDPDRRAPSDTGAIRRLLRRELKISDRDYVVLMVGSGFRTKGADRAMKAIAALPPELRRRTVLVIIGHDNFRPFRRLARRLNILSQIIFFHGRDDIPRFLFSADLLMHPAYRETTGLVLIEAMAAGLPVLATDVCGYSHYIAEARAGWLVPSPFHQNALNRMLADMLRSPQREDWRRNGRDYIARRDVFSMHSKAADIIEQVAIC